MSMPGPTPQGNVIRDSFAPGDEDIEFQDWEDIEFALQSRIDRLQEGGAYGASGGRIWITGPCSLWQTPVLKGAVTLDFCNNMVMAYGSDGFMRVEGALGAGIRNVRVQVHDQPSAALWLSSEDGDDIAFCRFERLRLVRYARSARGMTDGIRIEPHGSARIRYNMFEDILIHGFARSLVLFNSSTHEHALEGNRFSHLRCEDFIRRMVYFGYNGDDASHPKGMGRNVFDHIYGNAATLGQVEDPSSLRLPSMRLTAGDGNHFHHFALFARNSLKESWEVTESAVNTQLIAFEAGYLPDQMQTSGNQIVMPMEQTNATAWIQGREKCCDKDVS